MDERMITQRLEAEVSCLHCGRAAGLLRRDLAQHHAPTMFHAAGGAPVAILSLSALRCRQCGGSLFAEEHRVIDVYPDPSLLLGPRRGRPPKRVPTSKSDEGRDRHGVPASNFKEINR